MRSTLANPANAVRTLLRPGRNAHDHRSGSFDRRLLAPMILGSILNPVNSSILAVSLVPIGAAFGAPPSQTAWLVSGLYLATAIGQPVVGRLIDLYGPRRLYLAGTALVGVAGLVGVLAPNLGVLVLARVLLGFGTCAGYPAAMFLIRSEARRTGHNSPGGILTALAVANQTVAVLGPVLGGVLIGLGGWRTTLAVNLPLAVAGLMLGLWRLPKSPVAEPRAEQRSATGIDLPGIVTFAAMLVTLLLFLMDPRADRWPLPVLAVVAATAFVLRERRAAEPFVDVRVLAGNLPLLLTYARTLLAYVVAYSTLYGYTQWLQEGRGLSASQAGLAQFPIFLTAILVSTTTGPRKGIRGKLLVGAVGQVVASALLFLLDGGSAIWLLVVVACVFGIPQGLNSLALQNSVYHQADPARIGSSAGLLRTFTYLGAMAASCANGVLFSHRADTAGLHRLAWFMLAAAAGFLVLTIADRSLSSLTSSSAPNPSSTPNTSSTKGNRP